MLSTRNVFPVSYHKVFEDLCKQYGKLLQHQSDRDLPRTNFNTKYMSITRKNGHEMAGLLIVYLLVFSSNEGTNNLDVMLGNDRCSAFIHVFELLLLLENYCKQEEHTPKNLQISKKGLPYVMNTIKKQ